VEYRSAVCTLNIRKCFYRKICGLFPRKNTYTNPKNSCYDYTQFSRIAGVRPRLQKSERAERLLRKPYFVLPCHPFPDLRQSVHRPAIPLVLVADAGLGNRGGVPRFSGVWHRAGMGRETDSENFRKRKAWKRIIRNNCGAMRPERERRKSKDFTFTW